MPSRSDRRIESLLHALVPQVLGVLTRRYRDFAAAEDAVQEALLAAATQWPRDGVPQNPRGWLIHVAARRVTDQVRAEAARRRREAHVISLVPEDEQITAYAEESQGDDSLELLFLCCHPALTEASAIALTLRAVGGLSTAEIANAFLVPEATMAQRISRAKQALKTAEARFGDLDEAQRHARLSAVMHVLYLIFNEGYTASAGDALVRTDLSDEALRLTRMLHGQLPEEPEVAGLLSLMLLTDARRAARTGPAGELIPIDEQDRSLWDQAVIAEGDALVTQCFQRGRVGVYQLQAAIAAVHSRAKSAAATDWEDILGLYGLLKRITDSPVVALNHAVALAMVRGPKVGLARLRELEKDPRLAGGHRLLAVRGHLLERAGEVSEASACYREAAERTRSRVERDYLWMRAARLRHG